MRSGYTQDNVYLSVTTPLGKDVLLLHGIQGEEALSQPFHFTLELHSDRLDVDFSRVVGKSATISLAQRDGSERFFHGIITRFVQAGTFADFTRYIAELRPWFWLLTLTRDSRIFQNQTVPQILQQLFQDQGFTDFRLALRRTYTPREYCVQHQESAFDFASRLMEDEGIFYFFEHTKDRHTLVLADDAAAHVPCPGPGVAKVQGHLNAARTEDAVTGCELEQQVVPGRYALGDYFFETPSTRLQTQVKGKEGSQEQYEYPGDFTRRDVGERRGRVRLEAHEAQARTLRGQGHVRWFIPGYRFTLAEHERKDLNGAYVLRWVSHSATVEAYSNSFEAFPAATPFRPPRVTPRPVVHGVQSARVVGKAGEEIWTDRFGRVKVQFHWDREGKKDESSSCWMRVAQGQAGKGWGNFFLPHVGQEVLVTFLDGDPDRPIVTGSVYNAEQVVPYPLPAGQTKSTLRGDSSGKGEPNELRFEDKKGAEELYLHARRDMKTTVARDSVTEIQGNCTIRVRGNLTLDVGGSIKIKAGRSLTQEAKMSLTSIAGMNLTQKAKLALESSAGTMLMHKSKLMMMNDAQMLLSNVKTMHVLKGMPMMLQLPFLPVPAGVPPLPPIPDTP
ncbi:type VI secretion system Vgr family protein [Vitiosangium sp. GDMCC 1.1324]|uniref:type VI secretion system Vgr family protein n=1 Tax=Vitiosangium sp. (strain GDMCC 1.1324) TaxID=2138576 RepID=UPI000D33B978|nr:type VI secretion system tip protein VgrG [Vitiosangium sp. GDMCC 1.1324]PTL82653.1 type VI secretion system tip protein VgrG [Vitiosangium sp. GDMCC 1.1324]